MKTFKVLLPLAAFIIALAGSAFTPKKATSSTSIPYYWYKVTYQNGTGVVMSASDFVTQDEKANVISPCDDGTNLDCLRGFENELSSFPTALQGDDHIQKP